MKLCYLAFLLLTPVYTGADELPDAPLPKTFDAVRVEAARRPPQLNRRVFLTGAISLAAAKAADAITTRQLLNNGGVELNSIYGRHPSVGRQVGVNLGFYAAQTTAFYFTERSRSRWVRWAGRTWLTGVVVNHAQLAACNARIDPRGTEKCSSFPGSVW